MVEGRSFSKPGYRILQSSYTLGFDEGVVGMQVGGTRIFYIPSRYAYGPQRIGDIPPNSSLIIRTFEIIFDTSILLNHFQAANCLVSRRVAT